MHNFKKDILETKKQSSNYVRMIFCTHLEKITYKNETKFLKKKLSLHQQGNNNIITFQYSTKIKL